MSNIHVVPVPVEERIQLAILRCPDKRPHRIADCIKGATAAMVKEIQAKMTTDGTPAPQPPQRENSNFISLDKVKAKYDTVGSRIKAEFFGFYEPER